MGNLSEHFNREEFACKCGCGMNTVDYALLSILEDIREEFGQPITITSGCRCKNYNTQIDGAKNSQHLYSKAADFTVKDVEPELIQQWLDVNAPNNLGIGYGKTFTHLDVRDEKARWSY